MKSPASIFCLPSSAAAKRASSSSVLIAVTGMSPAILTETVWALAHEKPPTILDKVVVFATTRSRDQIIRELLETGIWEELRRTLKARPDQLIFSSAGDHIRVITRRGKELPDLRTQEDNRAAADFILEHLRSFTENPDLHIVASIAGGRKTMGALLYACMSLIGRETDRITHVLVDESLELRRDPKFYFPHSIQEARLIDLADIPFVPLRNRFVEIGRLPGAFSRLVAAYSRQFRADAVEEVTIRLDDATYTVTVDDAPVRLRERAYLVLKYMLMLHRENRVPRGIAIDREDFLNFARREGLAPEWHNNINVKEDIRRELDIIRKNFTKAGVTWMPGKRDYALHLPPFKLVTS